MHRLPLAWRPGLVAAGLVLLVCAVARPSSVRRMWRRGRRVAVAVAHTAGELLVLVEHRLTRWCRAHGRAPVGPLVRLTEFVDRRVVVPCQVRRAVTPPVPAVRRALVLTLVVAAFSPSAAWIAMARWPDSGLGRSTRAAFDGWTSLEQRLRLSGGGNVAAEQVEAPVTTVAPPPSLAWHLPGREAPALAGTVGDVPVAADVDGDGVTDAVAFRPTTGEWFTAGTVDVAVLGTEDDVPVPGDYRGEGRAALAVFRPSDGQWLIDGAPAPVVLGRSGDIPVPGAYAVPGRSEPAVYRPSTGEWLIAGRPEPVRFGEPGDVPVPADYDGDKVTDLAVYRPSTGQWWVAGAPAGPAVLGEPGDVPVPGAYAGSPRAVAAVYRPSTGELLVAGREPVPTGVTGGEPLVVRTRGGVTLAVVAPDR